MRKYVWPARGRPIRLLLLAWCLSYAGDLAAFTAASVYVYHVGGAAYVGLLGLLKALPGALLVPLAVLLLSMGLGSVVAPLLIDAWGARGALIATGLIVVVVVALSVPSLTAIDHRISQPGPDVALLRQVSFFGPLPFAIVEHLASELQSATYEPGDVIIQDGQPGERFYMITDGRVRVCKDGKELRQMGTGESFGEIALLRQVPRTATVIAMSRLQARTLTRDEFLCAVTGNAASAEGADQVISARLQAG